MSRFFETLKEVSRSQPVPNGNPPNGTQEGLGTGGVDPFPFLDPLELGPVSEPAEAPRLELPLEFPLELPPEDLLGAFVPPQRGLLGRVVKINLDRKAPLLPHTADNSIVEQYRRLRTKIQQQHAIKPIRSLLVASPGAGEGKTVTAMNLGLSFAMLPSFKVLVIDGDLRKGTVGKWLGVHNHPGLSNLIDGSAQPEDVIFKCDELPMHFMVSGTSKKPAAELLTSSVLGDTIRQMTQHFDLVLVDSPPVNLIADAQMLAGSCDGIMLVARVFSTTCKAFQKTMDDLLSFRIVGTVLNGSMRAQLYHRYGYY
jgi:protein-tyrosine kinase